jgi:FG-GAP repeat
MPIPKMRVSTSAILVASFSLFAVTFRLAEGYPTPAEAVAAAIPAALDANEFTLIGTNLVLKKGLVEIGDVDGNGAIDYAWISPNENDSAGAVRIYLMETPKTTLFIRHIVPGKWGFTGYILSKGDRFGASIAPIGDVNSDGVQDLAVGAPGDSETGQNKGAVYILLMKKDGSVLGSEKISASTDLSLVGQLVEGEEFGTAIQSIQDVNGNDVKELSVESKDGSRTMILLSSCGKSIAGMKFAAGVDPKVLEPRLSEGKIRVMPLRIDGMDDGESFIPSLKAGAPSQCFFNETHCGCRTFPSTSTCLDAVATEQGKTVCLQRPCQSGFKCDCAGTHLCNRRRTTESNYAVLPGAPTDRSLVYCGILTTELVRTDVIEGAAIPTPAPATQVSFNNVWTPTQCMCSREADILSGSKECLDFARQEANDTICTIRACNIAGSEKMICDAGGSSVCSHKTMSKSAYARAGDDSLVSGETQCALQTKEVEVVTCIDNCP